MRHEVTKCISLFPENYINKYGASQISRLLAGSTGYAVQHAPIQLLEIRCTVYFKNSVMSSASVVESSKGELEDFSWIVNLVDENSNSGTEQATNGMVNYVETEESPNCASTATLCYPDTNTPWSIWSMKSLLESSSDSSTENLNTWPAINWSSAVQANPWSDLKLNSRIVGDLPLWPEPRSTATCFPPMRYQFLGVAQFYVHVTNYQGAWPTCDNLQATVSDPLGASVAVEILKDETSAVSRYVCSFFSPIPGFYSVVVRSGLHRNSHIQGSPFKIPIARKYHNGISEPLSVNFVGPSAKAWGIAYSSSNNKIYVCDRESHQVTILNTDGTLDQKFGSRGSNPGQLFRPTGVAIDNCNARVIVTDKDNHRVSIFSLTGEFIHSFGEKGHKNGQFHYPWGVAASPIDGRIVVADSRNHRVQLLDSMGNFLRKFSVFETNPFDYKLEFSYPRGITFDNDGSCIYVSDFNVQAVFKLDMELSKKTNISPTGVSLNRPQGVAVDAVGNILVTDSRNNCIHIFSAQRHYISTIFGNQAYSFYIPQDVAVMSSGHILIVDSLNRIQVF